MRRVSDLYATTRLRIHGHELTAAGSFLVFCATEALIWLWPDPPLTVAIAGHLIAGLGIATLVMGYLVSFTDALTSLTTSFSRLLSGLIRLRVMWRDLWRT